MYNYSYNQERSISRLDELLNRNELIYQNLKLKLDQINKSNLNIHKNISHIHSHTQDPSRHNPPNNPPSSSPHHASSTQHDLPPNPLKSSFCLAESSFTLQDLQFRPIAPPLNSSGTIKPAEDSLLRKHTADSLSHQHLPQPTPDHNYPLSQKNMEISFEWQRSKTSEDSYPHQDRTAFLEIENNISRSRINQPSTSSHLPKAAKGNSIYLSQAPKIQVQVEESIIEEMPTFRQAVDSENRSEKKHFERQTTQHQEQSANFWRGQPVTSSNQPLLDSIFGIEDETLRKQLKQQGLNESNRRASNQLATADKRRSFFYKYLQCLPDSNPAKSRREQFNASQVDPQSHLSPINLAKDPQLHILADLPIRHAQPETISGRNATEACTANQSYVHAPQPLSQAVWEGNTQRQVPTECFLYVPFNKAYRSPILQTKGNGTILLQRKSKAGFQSDQNRSSDPIRYRFKHVLTDEQAVLKLLLGQKASQLTETNTTRIAIIGGKDTLKKKLHLGLLAFLLQETAKLFANSRKLSVVKIEHQQSGKEGFQAYIEGKKGSERIALLQLQRVGQDLSRSILDGSRSERVLRVTKVTMETEASWSFTIISTNRIDTQFARQLGADRICWSVNPLVKNYDEVLMTLEAMGKFLHNPKRYG